MISIFDKSELWDEERENLENLKKLFQDIIGKSDLKIEHAFEFCKLLETN